MDNTFQYDSPIHLYLNEQYKDHMQRVNDCIKDHVFEHVLGIGVSVDKDELLKALAYDRNQYAKGFADGAKGVAAAWTNVNNELPQKPGKYLVYSKVGTMYTSKFDPDIHKRWPHFGKVGVTHWMPRPEEPKE